MNCKDGSVKILCGVSGSGKSTMCKDLMDATLDVVKCSADDFFMQDGKYIFTPAGLSAAHASCLRRFIACCQDCVGLILVDNTNTTIMEIAPYAAIALAYGYDLEVIVVDAAIVNMKRDAGDIGLEQIAGGQAEQGEDLAENGVAS